MSRTSLWVCLGLFATVSVLAFVACCTGNKPLIYLIAVLYAALVLLALRIGAGGRL